MPATVELMRVSGALPHQIPPPVPPTTIPSLIMTARFPLIVELTMVRPNGGFELPIPPPAPPPYCASPSAVLSLMVEIGDPDRSVVEDASPALRPRAYYRALDYFVLLNVRGSRCWNRWWRFRRRMSHVLSPITESCTLSMP